MITIPLVNLRLEKPSIIDLGDSKIIPMGNASAIVQSASRLGIRSEEYALHMPCEYLLQTQSEATPELIQDILNRALTVFKLFKDSIVLSHVVIVGDPPSTVHEMRHYIPYSRLPIYTYSLREGEDTEFAKFWTEFSRLNPRNFAVYRFHLADFRPYLADRFVDYVESLEYMLVPDSGGREGEIRYKFSSRGTLILAPNAEADMREHLYRGLQHAYDLRSGIVHSGASGESTDMPLEDVIHLVRWHDREAIKFFFRADCLDRTKDYRASLLKRRLIFDAQMSWRNPGEFKAEESIMPS